MSSRAPFMILEEAIEAHPAMRAWERVVGSGSRAVSLEVWSEKSSNYPASVYRLVLPNGSTPVFAKHSDAGSGAVERLCYETLLPGARVPFPGYLGSLRDDDGTWWLFLEDAGRERFSAANPEHRMLAGHWIVY